MPAIVHHKKRIHYAIEGKQGPYLVLYHNWFGAGQDWYRSGYVHVLKRQFRLIIPDAVSHGRSERLGADDTYSLAELTTGMVAILDEIGAMNTHFLGFSLGAMLGMDLLRHHPSRIRIAILGGDSPFIDQKMAQHLTQLASKQPALDNSKDTQNGEQHLDLLDRHDPVDQSAAVSKLLHCLAAERNYPQQPFYPLSPLTFLVPLGESSAVERLHQARQKLERVSWMAFEGMTTEALLRDKTALLRAVHHALHGHRQSRSATAETTDST